MRNRTLSLSLVGLLAVGAFAAEPAQEPEGTHGEQSLSQAADDPTASITSVQIAGWHTAD